MTRWQDEETIDVSALQNLANPLDILIDFFSSIKLPSETCASSHVESTLAILTTLLETHDSTFMALTKARDSITTLNSRHIQTQQRLSEFAQKTSSDLSRIRSKIVKRNEDFNSLSTQSQILKSRLAFVERDRETQESLVLSMAQKLNDAEEGTLRMGRERHKMNLQIMQLKTHIQGRSLLVPMVYDRFGVLVG